jgi:hypothetical protein
VNGGNEMSPLDIKALQWRHERVMSLIDDSEPSERPALLVAVVAPGPELEKRSLEAVRERADGQDAQPAVLPVLETLRGFERQAALLLGDVSQTRPRPNGVRRDSREPTGPSKTCSRILVDIQTEIRARSKVCDSKVSRPDRLSSGPRAARGMARRARA